MNIKEHIKHVIDDELYKEGITLNWDINDLIIPYGGKSIIERCSSPGSLSTALIDHFFPHKLKTAELAHYTKLEKFGSILSSGTIRLNCLHDVIGAGEFKAFSEDYGFSGHVDKSGKPYDEQLMKQTFFTSFTNLKPKNEEVLWSRFGKHGAGVKLKFKIEVNRERSELRPMIYSCETELTKSLIKRITSRLEKECDRCFIIRGISRIGAFYLNAGYSLEPEEETRLIVKTWGQGTGHDLIEKNGDSSYFPIKIDDPEDDFCHIKLISVEAGQICPQEDVSRLLQEHGFGHVVVFKSQ